MYIGCSHSESCSVCIAVKRHLHCTVTCDSHAVYVAVTRVSVAGRTRSSDPAWPDTGRKPDSDKPDSDIAWTDTAAAAVSSAPALETRTGGSTRSEPESTIAGGTGSNGAGDVTELSVKLQRVMWRLRVGVRGGGRCRGSGCVLCVAA